MKRIMSETTDSADQTVEYQPRLWRIRSGTKILWLRKEIFSLPAIAVILMFLVFPAVCANAATAQQQPAEEDLFEMPLEVLMEQRVVTSSRRPQVLSRASSAMYIITAEDIRQSGVTTIEELLRFVPGMDVVRVNNEGFAVCARGFAKEATRRMQVLLDGQPLYDGYKGALDLSLYPIFLNDVDRIEVIRGPGGVAWGLKSMNGVINIITKKTADTQGGKVYGAFGNRELQQGQFRLGGTNGPLSWRGSVGGFHGNGFGSNGGDDIKDWFEAFQTAGRAEYKVSSDTKMTFLGGHKFSTLGGSPPTHRSLQYMNFLYEKRLEKDSTVQVQWGELFFHLFNTTYDLITREDLIAIQHCLKADNHNIVWGADYTRDSYDTLPHPKTQAVPKNFGNDQASIFAEDEITLCENLWFTLGGRGHYNELTNFDWAGRTAIVWEAIPKHYFRAAVSRSFRSPMFWEEFGREYSGSTIKTSGSDTLENERVVTYELGYRGLIWDNLELNVEGFINNYSDLIGMRKEGSVKVWRNVIDMKTYGVETAVDWKPFRWWLVRGSHSYEHQTDENKINNLTTGKLAVFTIPEHKVALTNRFYIDKTTTFNAQIYWTDTYFDSSTLPNRINPFFRVDIRLAKTLWNNNAEIAFGVNNLTDHFHYQGSDSQYEVPRQIYMQFFYKF